MDPPPITPLSLYLLIVILLHFPLSSLSKNPHCTPSSCGIIPNISYPFRLKADPKNCGDRRFELSCENDVAFFYLNSQKYYVKDIDDFYYGIRLVDASITNDTCSFPISSIYQYNFTDDRFIPHEFATGSTFLYHNMLTPINFISCPNPLENYTSSNLTYISAECYSNSSYGRYDYIKVGHMNASELTRMCRLDRITLTSWPEFKDLNNVSLSEIHDSLLYGFELYACPECRPLQAFNMWCMNIVPMLLSFCPVDNKSITVIFSGLIINEASLPDSYRHSWIAVCSGEPSFDGHLRVRRSIATLIFYCSFIFNDDI